MLRIREYFNSTQTLCEILDWICYCAFKVGIDSLTFASIGINTPTCVRISISCNHSVKYLTTGSSVWPTVTGAPKLTYANSTYIFCCTIHNLCTISSFQSSSRPWTRLDTVTSNAASAVWSASGTPTVCKLNIFANAPVTCSSTNSKRGELIRNGNAWRWWRPNRRAFNCDAR